MKRFRAFVCAKNNVQFSHFVFPFVANNRMFEQIDIPNCLRGDM